MKVGYARVSTNEQCLDLQVNALHEAGCEKIFTDEISGAQRDRPALAQLLEDVTEGDQVVVWKLDRLGRSLPHLIELIQAFGDRGADFTSLSEAIDTSTPGGELVFHLMAALAQFERKLISERTKAGMAAAKARGSLVGRPRRLSNVDVDQAREWIANDMAKREVARRLRVSTATLYRHLKRSRLLAS